MQIKKITSLVLAAALRFLLQPAAIAKRQL